MASVSLTRGPKKKSLFFRSSSYTPNARNVPDTSATRIPIGNRHGWLPQNVSLFGLVPGAMLKQSVGGLPALVSSPQVAPVRMCKFSSQGTAILRLEDSRWSSQANEFNVPPSSREGCMTLQQPPSWTVCGLTRSIALSEGSMRFELPSRK